MGIPMIVKKAFRPGGSGSPALKPGSTFEASDKQQAKLCRAMGWCEDAPATVTAAASGESAYGGGFYSTRAATARPAAKKVDVKRASSKAGAGTYSRRDLTAEE